MHLTKSCGTFPGSPVEDWTLPSQHWGHRLDPLTEELRSHMLHSTAKKIKVKNKKILIKIK